MDASKHKTKIKALDFCELKMKIIWELKVKLSAMRRSNVRQMYKHQHDYRPF